MKITKAEVIHVADLARLELDNASMETFANQIGTVIDYIDLLNTVHTEGVKPTTHAIFLTNALREDEEQNHLELKKTLSNAPEKEEEHFIVPKIIGG
ncbi:MAG: Asp-tRNA(Asn)/Glu-tRNA(Gln) amidotransferase subunit GatC [Desulfobacterales bacterium]